jgi:hypothetical protein
MQIRASWKQALKLCTPATIKLFTLITLKSMLDVIRVLMVPWFLIPFGLSLVALGWFGTASITSTYIGQFLTLFSSIIFILAARPSIGLKDAAYFKTNVARGLWMFFVYTILLVLSLSPFFLITAIQVYGQLSKTITAILMFSMLLFLLPCFLLMFFGSNFALLFYLDRRQDVWRAFKRACLMIWYNLPALVLYMFLYGVVTILVSAFLTILLSGISYGIYSSISVVIQLVLRMTINLLCICLATNLYIKLVHDQYELYFPEDAHKE